MTLSDLTNPAGQTTAAALAAIQTRTGLSQFGLTVINSFYPPGVAPTGSSQTLTSLGYTRATWVAALPAAYQASVPASLTGTDEADWAAAQTATNYVYDTGPKSGTENWTTGHFIFNGEYVVNQAIVFNHSALWIEGGVPNAGYHGTSIQNISTAGTADAPTWAVDIYLFNEFGLPPPGRVGSTAQTGGTKAIVEHIYFKGNGTASIATPSLANYASGLRIRKAFLTQVRSCVFGNSLYDGCNVTDAQLFFVYEKNFHYSVTRDCLVIHRNLAAQVGSSSTANFSTTVWWSQNEFGLQGRYSVLMDLANSIEAVPIEHENSYEGVSSSSWYLANPEFFVHGVKSPVCLLGTGELLSTGHRDEGGVLSGAEASIHFAGGLGISVEGNTGGHLYVTSFPSFSSLTITAITRANPGVVTYSGADLYSEGDHVYISGVLGMQQVNGLEVKILNLNTGAKTFQLSGLDTSAFGVYTSGGTVTMRSRTVAALQTTGQFDIQNITQANPGIVTYTGVVPFGNGDTIRFDGLVGGMTQVRNNTYTVAGLNTGAKTFQLSGINTSGFSAFTVGGSFATSKSPGYLDITDQRNYNCNGPGNLSGKIDGLTVRDSLNLKKILMSEEKLIGDTTPWHFEDLATSFWSIPTRAGTYARTVQPLTTATPTAIINPTNCIYVNATGGDGRNFGYFSSITNTGDYNCNGVVGSTWTPSTQYFATFGAAANNYSPSLLLAQPTTGNYNGFFYLCTTPGTSNSLEPTWGTTIGGTTLDNNGAGPGNVVWTCIGRLSGQAAVFTTEMMEMGKRIQYLTTTPTTQRWSIGDTIVNSAPSASGVDRWRATANGIGVAAAWKSVALSA